MTGPGKLANIIEVREPGWCVEPGRLMQEIQSVPDNGAESVLFQVVRHLGREAALELLDRAGVRGRAGGGFPTGHKWWLVSSAEGPEKYFVCNANLAEPGHGKESWLLLANPAKVIEAVAIGAYCTGARCAYIALPETAQQEISALEGALRAAYDVGTLGKSLYGSGITLDVKLVKTPAAHIAGEETALLEFIEGRPLQPRRKPPVPTAHGLFGKPTAVNNLETVMQARYALKVGVEAYRSVGAAHAPGTMIFTLRGSVNRPGVYELPLGTTLRELIFNSGGGPQASTGLKGIFPGGIGSAVLLTDALDTPLDFDSLRDRGSDMGSGTVVTFGEDVCAVELAASLARFFYEASCGKCRPCKDGTGRTLTMLTRIDRLDQPSVDVLDRELPASRRPAQPQLTIINNLAHGISYTDSAKGLDKISQLCEFYKFRGDCHHSTEAAGAVVSLLRAFPEEFNQHMLHGACKAPEVKVAAGQAMIAAG